MFSTKNLIEVLESLASNLENSGKVETAKFFRDIIANISKAKDLESCKEPLEKIINSGAMSQYAGFNHEQDALFDRAFDEAKKLSG